MNLKHRLTFGHGLLIGYVVGVVSSLLLWYVMR